jgi:hypothetical protein
MPDVIADRPTNPFVRIPFGPALLGAAFALTVALVGLAWTIDERIIKIELLTDSALLIDDPDVTNSLTAQWKGEEVLDLRLLEFRLRNTGSQAIRPDDFESGISFTLREGAAGEFLFANLGTTSQLALIPRISVSDEQVTIDPLLLNPGDSFTFKLITTSEAALQVQVVARIAGVSDVNVADERSIDDDGRQRDDEDDVELRDVPVLLIMGFVFVMMFTLMALMDRNVSTGVFVLLWPAVLCFVFSAYPFTLLARGVDLDDQTAVLWIVSLSISILSAILPFVILIATNVIEQRRLRRAASNP